MDQSRWRRHDDPREILSAQDAGATEGRDHESIALIAAERQRQISIEGWTPEHDAGHVLGELARAAACYALYAGGVRTLPGSGVLGRGWPWPWHDFEFKPGDDPVRTLVKAGALIAAEIDRLEMRNEQ